MDVDIRLHPPQRKQRATESREAMPVWGSWLGQWWPRGPRWPKDMASGQHGARAASQGQGAASQGKAPQPQSRPLAYHGISAADVVTKDEAMRFLDQERAAWKAQPPPRSRFRADITSGVSASSQGHFNWVFFVPDSAWDSQQGLRPCDECNSCSCGAGLWRPRNRLSPPLSPIAFGIRA